MSDPDSIKLTAISLDLNIRILAFYHLNDNDKLMKAGIESIQSHQRTIGEENFWQELRKEYGPEVVEKFCTEKAFKEWTDSDSEVKLELSAFIKEEQQILSRPRSQSEMSKSLSNLLVAHEQEIAELQSLVKDDVARALQEDPDDILLKDDVWYLRYLLSYNKGDREYTARKLRTALKIRNEQQHVIKEAQKRNDAAASEHYQQVGKYIYGDILPTESKSGNICYFGWMGGSHLEKMNVEFKEIELIQFLIKKNETWYLDIDARTREQKAQRKLIRIIDLDGFSVFQITGKYKKLFAALKSIAKECDVMYPQFISNIIFVNPPRLIKMAMSLVRPFLSDAILAKLHICVHSNVMKDPLMASLFNREDLPEKIGGTLKWMPQDFEIDM